MACLLKISCATRRNRT